MDKDQARLAFNMTYQVVEKEKPIKLTEFKLKTKVGNFVYLKSSGIPLKENGEVYAVLCIAKDITEHKKVEQRLKEHGEKFKLFMENANDMIFIMNNKFKIEYVNEFPLLRSLGYSNNELIDKLPFDIIHPDDHEKSLKEFKKCLNGGIGALEVRVRHKDGHYIWIEPYGTRFTDKNGKQKVLASLRDITERKKAEKRLKEFKEKYRIITKNANDIILILDNNFKFEYISNQSLFKILGYSSNEVIDQKPIKFIHPDDHEKTFKEFKEIIKGIGGTVEVRVRHKDGKYIWTESDGNVFIDKKGEPKLLVILRDVTKRKIIEKKLKKSEENLNKLNKELEQRIEERTKELKESEEKYRNMINNLDVGFCKIKIDGTILNHNPALNKIVGFDPSKSLIGLKIPGIWQYPGEGDKHLKEILEKGFVKNHLVFAKKVNGDNIVLQVDSHIIKNNEGKVISIEGICSDITEKFNLEERFKESEERYRLISENANDLITILNQKFEHEYINEKTYLKVLGYSNDDMLGKPRLDLVYPEDIKQGIKVLRDGFKHGEGKTELRLRHKNGHYLWFEIKGKTFTDNNGEIKALAISRDITKKKEAENLIKEEIDKLKELDQIRRDFISRASHELKTPLTSVYSATNLLLQLYKDQLGKNALELVEMIKKGGSRLKFLVENLLDISSIESGRFQLNKKMENLSDVIRDCIQSITYLANKRGIIVNVELPEKFNIEVDKLRIGQVILNLLSNAIKNTPTTGEIKIDLIKNDGFLDISIKDNGIGLTKKELNKIFQKFGKIERYGKGLNIDTEGSGLGLFISKEIVEKHGGQILVESEGRNKGANFIVRLPLK